MWNYIEIFKYVLSTMGVSKESISKFLIGNRFHMKLRILSPYSNRNIEILESYCECMNNNKFCYKENIHCWTALNKILVKHNICSDDVKMCSVCYDFQFIVMGLKLDSRGRQTMAHQNFSDYLLKLNCIFVFTQDGKTA